tara:strand:+ start:565 stop:726 length:162 start_codon:yes stop_codon:yes gene_type:complete
MDLGLFFWYVFLPFSIPFLFGMYLGSRWHKEWVMEQEYSGDNSFFYAAMYLDD